jgi:serine protease Do
MLYAAEERLNAQTDERGSGKVNTLEAMQATSAMFRAAAAKVAPSLVTIESWGGVGAREGKIGGIRKQGEGNTTGIAISADGYIITSTFNFITRPPIIMVVTRDNKRHTAQLHGQDDLRKICLLKIIDLDPDEKLVVPEIASLDKIEVGHWAVSMGVGYGDRSPALSMGIISAKNRIGGRAIQTDANISPANYGGPLVDIDGRVIGICVPMNPQSQAIGAGVEWYDSGIGFAIPLDGADELIERLKDPHVKIEPAFLGVKADANPTGEGMWIAKVVPNSAADKAGLEREDVLLTVDGKPVADLMELKKILISFEAGQKTTLEYLVEGKGEVVKKDITFIAAPVSQKEIDQLEPPEIR